MVDSRPKDTKKRGKDDDRPAIWVGYGRLVRLFRERAALTQQQLADAIGYSYDLVASVERGRRPAKSAFTKGAERVLEAGGALTALQEEVDRARLPMFFQDFALLEADAISFSWYGNHIVPGLLQTEDCARALLQAHCPPLAAEIIEQRLDARLARQDVLTRTPTVELSFIIGEPVLHCPVGGPRILQAQLRHLLECAELCNAEVQIMPMSHGSHAGLHGPMVLLGTKDHRSVAYFESHGESVVISDPDKVSAFGLRYGKLRSQALNSVESGRLIERVAGEL